MHNPKVSIIVPVYNVSQYIDACLRSIEAQSYWNVEVIFVDDCGTDNSVAKIKEYTATHSAFPQHKIISHTHNRGLSAARNSGTDAATGDYIYYLDSDDTIAATCIESLVAPLEKKAYDVVIGGVSEEREGEEPSTISLRKGTIDEPLKAYANGEWYVMAWNKLCNREFIQSNKLRFKEGMLHEDVAWSFQLACLCRTMYAVGTTTYNYKIRSASIMTSMSIEKDVQIYLEAFTEIKRFVEEQQLTHNKYVYQMVEGKKSGILYSLLQKGESEIYNKYYPTFHKLSHISPFKAYRKKMIGMGYLLRDANYCLPQCAGRIYKKCFYLLFYRLRRKKIQGAIWK